MIYLGVEINIPIDINELNIYCGIHTVRVAPLAGLGDTHGIADIGLFPHGGIACCTTCTKTAIWSNKHNHAYYAMTSEDIPPTYEASKQLWHNPKEVFLKAQKVEAIIGKTNQREARAKYHING